MSELARRFLLLVLTLGLGLLIGLFGHSVTGDTRWFLAIPAVMAVAWFWVTDTSPCSGPSCLTPHPREPKKKPAAGSPPTTGS